MPLESALQAFATEPLLTAARGLFKDTLKIPHAKQSHLAYFRLI